MGPPFSSVHVRLAELCRRSATQITRAETFNNHDIRSLVLPLTTVVIALLMWVVIYRVFFHPLAHFPGPFPAKVSGYWRTYQYSRGNWHNDIVNIHKKYGRVVRIAPNELAIVDENAMETLYGHGTKAMKTTWYSVWDVPNTAPQLFSELDKSRYGFLRKRLSGAYSMSSIMKYEVYIQSCLDLLWAKLSEQADQGNVVNMSEWSNAFAFDVIGELAYGEKLGHLEAEQDVGGLRGAILTGFIMLSVLGHLPGQSFVVNNSFVTKLSTIFGAPPPFGGFRDWSEQKVKNRMDSTKPNDRQDLLSHFCKMKTADGQRASFREVLVEAMNLVGAGADTTSIGIRSCLYFTAMSPHVYNRLKEEVDQFYKDNNLTGPITYLQTQKLPFLQAVVKEAMRVLPSIVFQLLRYSPPGFSVRGQEIPPGTAVGISPVAQNHDTEIWGPDADEFRPERWLEDEARAKYWDTSLMTFGGNGPRMCIGRNIALVELHKFLAQFIHHFDFEIVNKRNPWRITTFWFAYQRDLKMSIRRKPEFPIPQI